MTTPTTTDPMSEAIDNLDRAERAVVEARHRKEPAHVLASLVAHELKMYHRLVRLQDATPTETFEPNPALVALFALPQRITRD